MIPGRAIDQSPLDSPMSKYRGSRSLLRSTVQLRHTLPNGSHHFDWLLDVADAPQSPLTTFRLPDALHTMKPGSEMRALRIADHRRLYLEYEGKLSDNRGSVKRVTSGLITEFSHDADEWNLTLQWDESTFGEDSHVQEQRLLLRCEGDPAETMQTWFIFFPSSQADFPSQ